MARILVVDYSRSGNTHKAAKAIARRCGADLEDIRDVRPRHGLRGWLRSAREAIRQVPAEIKPMVRDPAGYDLVVLGSPVWTGHVSSPMRRYLRDTAGTLGRIALFVTEGGRGGARALAEMARLARCPPVATLELREKDLGDGLQTKLADFVERLQAAAASARPKRAAR